MRTKFGALVVIFLLVLAGAGSIGLRTYLIKQLRANQRSTWWRLTYRIELDSDKAGAKIQVAIPTDTPHARVFRENLSFGDLIASRSIQPSGTSLVSFSTQNAGLHFILAQFDLELSQSDRAPQKPSPEKASITTLARYLRATPTIQTQSAVVQETIKELRSERVGPIDPVQQIFDFCSIQIEDDVEGESSGDAEGVLSDMVGTELGRAKAMVALCRADNIHARVVTGFRVGQENELLAHHWVETLRDKIWESHDLQSRLFNQLPGNYLPIRYDGDQLVFLSDREGAEVTFSLSELSAQDAASFANRRPAQILDLTRLPPAMHPVLAVILLIPLGALVTSIFQVMVGIRTIGTFSPTLIAVSFVMADWRTGVAVFALVIFVGLISRALIDRLRLLMVPKLSFILTLVVVILVFTISVLDYMRLTPSPQAVLLPMVILTMTIERFYVATAEEGFGAAFGLLLNTILVSFVCFLTVGWLQVGQLVMAYPEVHFFTLAAIVFVGRYNGYRIAELWRFRDLRQPEVDGRVT